MCRFRAQYAPSSRVMSHRCQASRQPNPTSLSPPPHTQGGRSGPRGTAMVGRGPVPQSARAGRMPALVQVCVCAPSNNVQGRRSSDTRFSVPSCPFLVSLSCPHTRCGGAPLKRTEQVTGTPASSRYRRTQSANLATRLPCVGCHASCDPTAEASTILTMPLMNPLRSPST